MYPKATWHQIRIYMTVYLITYIHVAAAACNLSGAAQPGAGSLVTGIIQKSSGMHELEGAEVT